ncbi:hypothetical protein BS78_05G281400 [Paspalum vaginatum]|nr:hypothetical protein BS78_05G281400 [Paspalum vaginatum]
MRPQRGGVAGARQVHVLRRRPLAAGGGAHPEPRPRVGVVEPVPTPRLPLSAADAAELLASVSAAARRGGCPACRQVVADPGR